MICAACATPAGALDRFCGECGWPLKQPSPYGGDERNLPVTRWEESRSRDAEGRALAYDPDPKSGRAYVPGETSGARDKIPDVPQASGLAGRRSGEIVAGQGAPADYSAPCNPVRGAGIGAGRLVWADDRRLYAWDLRSERVQTFDLGAHAPVGPEAVLACGWRTYLATAQGWAVHDGRSGAVATISMSRPTAVAAISGGAVAAFGREIARVDAGGARETLPSLPIEPAALAGEGNRLVAFGATGEIFYLVGGEWRRTLDGAPRGGFRQGWIVNGRAGVLLASESQTQVAYEPSAEGLSPTAPISIEVDGLLGVVPGKSGWEGHRLVAFVGGASPRATVIAPASSAPPESRPLDTSSLGATATVVRRSPDGAGAITVAYVDPDAPARLKFAPVREASLPLPDPFPLAHGANDIRLFPTIEGLVVLAHNGSRAMLKLIPYPQ
ncbi:hypothetical protein BH11ARM2_BH11ARM2_26760 [soil metagenome]